MGRELSNRSIRMLLAALLSLPLSFGQGTTAQITGRITDPSGAVIVNARVAVTSADTGITREVASNESGYYTVSLLPPGTYQLSVETPGFRPESRSGLTLTSDQTARIDISLEVGQVTEGVTVLSAAPMLETLHRFDKCPPKKSGDRVRAAQAASAASEALTRSRTSGDCGTRSGCTWRDAGAREWV